MNITIDPMAVADLQGAFIRQFRADVVRGLRARPKELPCKYFYDEAGSALFERITQQSEYYLTRTELSIMRQHAAEMSAWLGEGCLLMEYGSGNSMKTRLLLDHLQKPAGYIPIDVSSEHLERCARALALDYRGLEVMPLCADFTQPLALPATARQPARRCVYFPGSTVGNCTPTEAIDLLRRTAELCGAGGGLLLGADLQKDSAVIEAAYNDRHGVTAAFNRNLLVRMNRELGADFAVERFAHRAFYDGEHGRIEMHLVSERDQSVQLGGMRFFIANGESIRTEYSYKYRLLDLQALADAAGFSTERVWTDERGYFSVLAFKASAAR
jgi:L-histidine Nalpha-methyltransferase